MPNAGEHRQTYIRQSTSHVAESRWVGLSAIRIKTRDVNVKTRTPKARAACGERMPPLGTGDAHDARLRFAPQEIDLFVRYESLELTNPPAATG